jgi:hypothetical protein
MMMIMMMDSSIDHTGLTFTDVYFVWKNIQRLWRALNETFSIEVFSDIPPRRLNFTQIS